MDPLKKKQAELYIVSQFDELDRSDIWSENELTNNCYQFAVLTLLFHYWRKISTRLNQGLSQAEICVLGLHI